MLDYSIYVLYRAASAFVSLLPLRLLFSLGQFFGLCAWAISRKYRRLARNNLRVALGDRRSESELSRLTRQHFRRLGANLLCTVKIGTMPLEKAAKCLAIENLDVVHNELRAGRPIVMVLSHLGPWELFAQLLACELSYAPRGSVFQQLGNRYIDADVREKRARAGLQLFDRREGFHGAIELLRSGGIMGVLSDQHAGDHGLWTPFFSRLASTTPLAGLLAKRTKAAVISGAIFTAGPARWRMVFTPKLNEPSDSVEEITAKVNRAIAEQIASAPEDWFWVHNRWKTPKPNFLLPRYKRGIYLPPEPFALKPFRILIRGTNWLGDSVISVPAVRAIKRGRPDAHITVAAPEKLAAVWKLVAEVDDVVPLPASSPLAVARRLKREDPFDVAVLFPNSLRSALEVRLAGIPRRVGFAGHNRRWLLNQIVPDVPRNGPIRHQVHHYLHLAETLGADIDGDLMPRPVAGVASKRAEPLIALCPGAEYGPAKRWLPERFAEVAARVSDERGAKWVLFGVKADAANGKVIADALGDRCVNRIGETTLEELTNELRKCDALLTNDTGTMHLATLLGVPVVAVFGSTEHRLTGPLGEAHTVIRHHVACSPCFLRKCPIDFRCMHAVTADEVTARLLELLGEPARQDNSVARAAHSE